MVEILTTFMFLTAGSQPIELAVAGNVAAVEVRLDGEVLGVLKGEPWTLPHDFGTELQPRELVAVAFDADGRELDRTRQWVNLNVATVDARLELETDEAGRPTAARIAWESIGVRKPRAVEVTFDGQALPVEDVRHIPLPAHDPEDLHFLTARVVFTDEREVRLDATFGGLYGEEVATELTAVPVVDERGGKLPAPKDMEGWFVKGDQPLQVQAVEKGEADIVIVREPAAQDFFDTMTRSFLRGVTAPRRAVTRSRRTKVSRLQALADASLRENLLFPSKTHTTFMSPYAVTLRREELTGATFLGSRGHPAGDQGFLWLAQHEPPAKPPVQLAHAVALAGMEAHGSSHRRAVILILGGEPEDHSVHSVTEVRAFLRKLRVPLHVWSMTSPEPHPEWGEVTFVGYPPKDEGSTQNLSHAVKDIGRHLRDQRIVWIRGRHLPQSIALSDKTVGLRLAGSSP